MFIYYYFFINVASRHLCAWKAALLTEPAPLLLSHLLRRYWSHRSVLVPFSCGLIKTFRLDSSSEIGMKRELEGGLLESYRRTRQSVSLTGNFRDNCSTDSSAIGAWSPERSHINDLAAPRPLEVVLLNGQELQIPNQKRQCDTGAKAEALRRW